MEFITDAEWQEIKVADSPKVINEALLRLHHRTIEDALRSMPELISRLVKKSQMMQQLSADFFEKNKDFQSHKSLVGETVTQIELAQPTADYAKILELATPAIRQKIQSLQSAGLDKSLTFKGE